MSSLKITQRRSLIGRPPDQRATMRALGLRRIGSSVVKTDSPTLRGMLFKVSHLIDVEDGAERLPTKDGAERLPTKDGAERLPTKGERS